MLPVPKDEVMHWLRLMLSLTYVEASVVVILPGMRLTMMVKAADCADDSWQPFCAAMFAATLYVPAFVA